MLGKYLNKQKVWNILRIFFGLLFIFSGIMKVIDLDSFYNSLNSFKMFNTTTITVTKYIIPLAEILLGSFLLLKIKPVLISQLLTGMLTLFTAVVIAKVIEGEEISCNCFGYLSDGKIDFTTIIRNILLILYGLILTSYYNNQSPQINKTPALSYFNRLKNKSWLQNTVTVIKLYVLFFLAVQTIILAIQNNGLKKSVSLLLMNNEILQPDTKVNSLNVFDLDSNLVNIDYEGNDKTIIYLMSTKCEPCNVNLINWIKLTESLNGTEIRIIGIAVNPLQDLKNYLKKTKINFNVYSLTDTAIKLEYKAFTTPQTIIVGKEGKVISAIPGILNEASIRKLFKELSFQFEG